MKHSELLRAAWSIPITIANLDKKNATEDMGL
jgi:hypothetical protein